MKARRAGDADAIDDYGHESFMLIWCGFHRNVIYF
jgi:hypothetical protein